MTLEQSSSGSLVRKLLTSTVIFVVLLANQVQLANATIIVISKATNETVFSAEEIGIDAASAYDLRGGLVIAEPSDACTEVRVPPVRNQSQSFGSLGGQQQRRWILWATYNYTSDRCSLSKKAKEAERVGYSAIIITVHGKNDTDGVLPSFMGFDWMGIRIYTSILGESMGSTLKKYAYPKEYDVEFVNEPYFQLGLLANFVFLGCLGIVIVVVLLRVFHCLYTRVSTSVQERRRKRKAFLTESQLKKLPVLHWRTSIPQDTCSICIENFEVGEEIRVLPCSHVFHKVCIDPWLIHSSRRCPNCKGKVIFPNEQLSDSSNSDSDSHMEDSEDDFGGNERTPLLRSQVGDIEEHMEDTRFVVDVLTESRGNGGLQNQRSNSASMGPSALTNSQLSSTETACLIDITSDVEQPISDDSFGSFQSAKINPNDSSVESMGSVQSFNSEQTFVGNEDLSRTEIPKNDISEKKNEDFNVSVSSSASFFSCTESELEKSNSSKHHELFQSFSS